METTNQQPKTTASEVADFFQSPFVKLALMTILILLLLIPLSSIRRLIEERKQRQITFEWQLNNEWGGKTKYSGIAIRVPYATDSKKLAYFYPTREHDNVSANVFKKHRGIYTSQLYRASILSSAQFEWDKMKQSHPGMYQWNAAQLCLVLDNRSRLTKLDSFSINGRKIEIAATDIINGKRILYAPVGNLDSKMIEVWSGLNLNGSSELTVSPIASSHTMNLRSDWKDPAFEGNSLPANTHIDSKKGFESSWQSLDVATGKTRAHSTVASPTKATVRFIEPVDFYQLNERTIKYGILVLSLTFAVFFLIELTNKMSINPIHYVLIGLGLMLFYLLLLSFSEQVGFIGAYIIAGISIIALIGWYSRSILQSTRFASLISLSLVLLYSFLIVIVHLEVYALIAGSIGLLVVLFLIMNVTRKLKYTPTT